MSSKSFTGLAFVFLVTSAGALACGSGAVPSGYDVVTDENAGVPRSDNGALPGNVPSPVPVDSPVEDDGDRPSNGGNNGNGNGNGNGGNDDNSGGPTPTVDAGAPAAGTKTCADLAACCAALPEGDQLKDQCTQIAANGANASCAQAYTSLHSYNATACP